MSLDSVLPPLFDGGLLMVGGFVMLCSGLVIFLMGFGDLYDRRRTQNMPLSKCRSVALGAIQLSGKAAGPNAMPSLVAQIPAFLSQVVVQECRTSGNRKGWTTIHKQEFRMPFYLEDETGHVKVNPDSATLSLQPDVVYSSTEQDAKYTAAALNRELEQPSTATVQELFQDYCDLRNLGSDSPLRFAETNLCPGDPVYVSGMAVSGKDGGEESEAVVLCQTTEQPLLIAEGSESDVIRKTGLHMRLRLLAGAAAMLLGAGCLAGAVAAPGEPQTGFATLEALMAAAVTFFVILGAGAIIYGIVLYNGLVSLRNEVERAFSNIDVLLKQRFDVLPNLVVVCKAYMQHESNVFQAITEAHGVWTAARDKEAKLKAAANSREALKQLFAVSEAYPRLRADESFERLQKFLTGIEEQIADRRELYNSAVSLFNTRLQEVPDKWVAGPFGFKSQPFFSAGTEAQGTVPAARTAAS